MLALELPPPVRLVAGTEGERAAIQLGGAVEGERTARGLGRELGVRDRAVALSGGGEVVEEQVRAGQTALERLGELAVDRRERRPVERGANGFADAIVKGFHGIVGARPSNPHELGFVEHRGHVRVGREGDARRRRDDRLLVGAPATDTTARTCRASSPSSATRARRASSSATAPDRACGARYRTAPR